MFFGQKLISWPYGQFLPKACHTYSESYWSGANLKYFGTLYVHPVPRQIFWLHHCWEVAPLAETLSIRI